MRIIRLELYRAFHSRTFYISLLIGFLICVLDLVTFCAQFGIGGRWYLAQAWIGTDYRFVYNTLFYILLPVIACLPYGGSLYTDMQSGYDKNICIKVSRLNYSVAKGSAVFLSAFVSVALPLAVDLFIAAGLYSNYLPERLEFMSVGLLDRNLFTTICNFHPLLYALLFILIDGLFAGAIALISLSISRLVKSHFTAVVTPMVIYITSSIFMQGDNYGNWGVIYMLNPYPVVPTLWYQMLIAYIVIFGVDCLIIWLITRKRDVL